MLLYRGGASRVHSSIRPFLHSSIHPPACRFTAWPTPSIYSPTRHLARPQVALILLGPILMISSAIGCLVVGVPIWALPAPLVAAAGVAMYCESGSIRDYLFVVIGGLSTAAWFLHHHFWFLDVSLDGMHLRTLCGLIFAALVPAFVVPGLVLGGASGQRASITGLMLIMQASIVAVLEEHLYAGDYLEVTFDVHPMFPASLVLATSVLGVYLTRRLQERQRIGWKTAFVLECIYGAKISMIFVPETRLAIPVIAYALATLHPFFLAKGDGAVDGGVNLDVRRQHERSRPAAHLILLAFVAVLLSVAASRFAVFDALHILLERKPSESVAAGSLLLATAAGWVPMVMTYFGAEKASSRPKRAVVLVGSLGLLLILLRPPLPIKGGGECPQLPLALCPRLWDASHTPEHEVDDVAVYGDGLRRREHWPLWMVVAASFSGILASTSAIRANALFAPIRLIQGGVAGLLVGGYMALEFFPGMFQVQVLAAASCVVVAFIVVFLSVPSKGSAVLLPIFGLAWLASLPLALFVLELSSLPPLPPDMVRLHPDVAEGLELDRLRRSTTRMYLMSSMAAQALMVSFAGKLRLGRSHARRTSSAASPMLGAAADAAYIDKAADFLGGYVSSSVNRANIGGLAGVNYQKIKAVGMSYLPEVVNLVTVMCYGLCLWVNSNLNGEHMPAMTLVLSPILLLLSQDSILLRKLTDRRRYFPPYAAAACVLLYIAASDVVSFGIVDLWSTGVPSGGLLASIDFDAEFLGVNVAAIMLCLPSIFGTIGYLWSQKSTNGNVWVSMVTGLAAMAAISVSDTDVVEESVKTLVGVAVVSAVVLSASKGERKKRRERIL